MTSIMVRRPRPILRRPTRVRAGTPACGRCRPREGLASLCTAGATLRPGQGAGRGILVLGGCRSGKTAWAEAAGLELIRAAGHELPHAAGLDPARAAGRNQPILIYIATAAAGNDASMQARIARHQALRHPLWQTVEAPLDLPEALARVLAGAALPSLSASSAGKGGAAGQHAPGPLPLTPGAALPCPQVVLIDCISVWLSNLMAAGLAEQAVLAQAAQVAELLRAPACPVLVVSNETGLGVAPSTPLGNAFRDVAGLVNQMLAKSCAEAYFIVSGLACKLKGIS